MRFYHTANSNNAENSDFLIFLICICFSYIPIFLFLLLSFLNYILCSTFFDPGESKFALIAMCNLLTYQIGFIERYYLPKFRECSVKKLDSRVIAVYISIMLIRFFICPKWSQYRMEIFPRKLIPFSRLILRIASPIANFYRYFQC